MDFSVLMSVYKNDNSLYFKKAVKSIINQTLRPSQIVIVVDGDVPSNLNKVLTAFARNSLIDIYRLPKNVGLGLALKEGLIHCKYDYVARMDSDDISVKNRFELQMNCFKNNLDLDLVGGYIEEFKNDENNIQSIRKVPLYNENIVKYCKKRCPFNHVTVMFKKKSVLDASGYLDLLYDEDYYLWVRMIHNNCNLMNIDKVLVKVRIDNNTFARRGGVKYFKSEKFIYQYMLKNKMINHFEYYCNLIIRIIIQILLPNKIRQFVFLKFFRQKEYKGVYNE